MFYEPYTWMSDEADFRHAPETMGFEWSSLLGPGIGTGVNLLTGWLRDRSQPSGGRICMNGQVSGDEAMTNCVPVVMGYFDDLEIQIAYGAISPADAVIAANNIADIFSDNRYFNQSIGGRSATIREAAKNEARQRADAIIAQVNALLAANQQAAPTTPGVTNGLEIDTKTLAIAGGGFLLLLFLLK